MPIPRLRADEEGQGTVEWIALVLLVSLLVGVLGAVVGVGLPGAALAHAIGDKLVCAAGLSGACDAERSELAVAYGDELAALVAEHAPELRYESGMRALPVDFRSCREDPCAEGAEEGAVSRSLTGEPATAFVHAIDCRPGAALARPREASCSGARAGSIYVQYWLYYPGSATGEGSIAPELIRELTGGATHHPDDFESYQLRIGPSGRSARASAHRGYGDGWTAEHGSVHVAGGSHAGSMRPRDFSRWTRARDLSLIPVESLDPQARRARFAVTPPWRKRVWRDPEYDGTD
ncbi:MAG: hypothetical protein ACRDKX_06520 [Solirubrobacterales bacterium]